MSSLSLYAAADEKAAVSLCLCACMWVNGKKDISRTPHQKRRKALILLGGIFKMKKKIDFHIHPSSERQKLAAIDFSTSVNRLTENKLPTLA